MSQTQPTKLPDTTSHRLPTPKFTPIYLFTKILSLRLYLPPMAPVPLVSALSCLILRARSARMARRSYGFCTASDISCAFVPCWVLVRAAVCFFITLPTSFLRISESPFYNASGDFRYLYKPVLALGEYCPGEENTRPPSDRDYELYRVLPSTRSISSSRKRPGPRKTSPSPPETPPPP